jgi:homoserine O-acetyltransferase
MNSNNTYYKLTEPFVLESGELIQDLKLAYQTFGTLNSSKTNVVWCFHALSANANVLDWWPGLFGKGSYFDPADYFIICVNSIGSPYGSTNPLDHSFPNYTVRDVVKSQLILAQHLDINSIQIAIGGSFGGSQALEFAYSYSGQIKQLIIIAAAAQESPWGIAVHEAQRLALEADSSEDKIAGLKAARAIGMLTYRTVQSLKDAQQDTDDKTGDFKAASYINYQGEKFTKRFDAWSYYYLTKCLDSHNLGRNRGGTAKALAQIQCPALVIGITSDQLIPISEVKKMTNGIANGQFYEIESNYGHDGFLLETTQITQIINHYNN